MKRIETYEIINHGVMYSDYFQGCGTAFTEFTDVATGIGSSEREALDDALEMLAQQDWDTASNPDLVIDFESADDTDVIQDIIDTETYNGDWPYVFVSVRVR